MRPVTRMLLVATAIALVASLSPGPRSLAAGGEDRYRESTQKIARGLKLIKIKDTKTPNRIRVLQVNLAKGLTIDLGLAHDEVTGLERTTHMARDHAALAATNGTYGLSWGRPMGTFVEDGDLKTTPLEWGRAFASTYDETGYYIGHPRTRIDVYEMATGAQWTVDQWNDSTPPDTTEIAGYSPAGGSGAKPPTSACSVRLYPAASPMWGKALDGVGVDYVVDRVKCSSDRVKRKDGLVLSAPLAGTQAYRIQGLIPGQLLRVTWSVGWPKTLDVIAGNPTLLSEGTVVVEDCSDPFCKRNPRTGVGYTAEGKVLLVTVDGRRKKSAGMTTVEFAKEFRRLGATWALNLDGGGSTTMVVGDEILNRPSDEAGERAVSSAVLVLSGDDPEEAVPAPYVPPAPVATPTPTPTPTISPTPTPTPTGTPTPSPPGVTSAFGPIGATPVPPATFVAPLGGSATQAAGRLLIADPASTGGLLHALAEGAFAERPASLPPELLEIVRIFADARRSGEYRF